MSLVLSLISVGLSLWYGGRGGGDGTPGGSGNVIINAAGNGGIRNAANNGYIKAAGG